MLPTFTDLDVLWNVIVENMDVIQGLVSVIALRENMDLNVNRVRKYSYDEDIVFYF